MRPFFVQRDALMIKIEQARKNVGSKIELSHAISMNAISSSGFDVLTKVTL
jgi:hypothetical protein